MEKNLDVRDTKVEIDLGKLAHNMKLIKTMVGDEVSLMAVVKANGYGHGAVAISETLMNNGASYLAVATLSEAIEIKESFPDYPVLVMGHTPDKYALHAVAKGITLTVFTYEQADYLNKLGAEQGIPVSVHIKIDTGFHRLGLPADRPEETLDIIRRIVNLPMVNVEGIFSHLALVNDAENAKQFKLLMHIVTTLKSEGITFRYTHIADSIATVDYPQYRLNMVRVGALIYGMRGFHVGFVPVEQIMTFKTAISRLHNIKKGEGVSYDYLWKAPRDSVIATLPFGYADGYPRNMRGKGYVTIKGIKCPLVGVLCMDQCMADVTDVPGIMVGTEAIIYGMGKNEMTIAEAAELAETNKNDIIARITPRPPRMYK